MKDDELTENGSPPNATATNPYRLLVQQTRKIGRAATGAFHDLKQFLHTEIPLPSKDHLLGGFSISKKEKTLKRAADIKRLQKLVRHSHEELARAWTVFPLTLFPHSIVVDRTKITITKRSFFWSSSVVSIRVDDILNVSCDVGPLFGAVTIASRVMNSVDHFEISFLWRSDAIHLKHIIQGYVFARQNDIDLSRFSRGQLLEMLEELGHD